MQRVLIIGATSAIAEATARLFASRNASMFLVARNMDRLSAIAADLRVRGAKSVEPYYLDVDDIGAHRAMLDTAWNVLGGVDIALIAHGTLPNQELCDESVDKAMKEFATNGTSTIALSLALAQRLAPQSTLAVISSVAGDRGRATNFLYGSAKAAVSTYLSGLRQKLHRSGVNVLTIKPGFVDTPMTKDFKKSGLWARPATIASGIVSAIDRRRSEIYLPSFWYLVMTIIRHLPEFIFRRLKL